ncbi:MAG: TSUP family transporter [Chloroflexota bacterium]
MDVPLLAIGLGQDAHAAVSTSLVVVGANATGAVVHLRRGNVRLREAFIFGTTGIGAAYLGARLSYSVPGSVLLVLFVVLMIGALKIPALVP